MKFNKSKFLLSLLLFCHYYYLFYFMIIIEDNSCHVGIKKKIFSTQTAIYKIGN